MTLFCWITSWQNNYWFKSKSTRKLTRANFVTYDTSTNLSQTFLKIYQKAIAMLRIDSIHITRQNLRMKRQLLIVLVILKATKANRWSFRVSRLSVPLYLILVLIKWKQKFWVKIILNQLLPKTRPIIHFVLLKILRASKK